MKKRAFSLTEIIIVIAIVGLLSVIALVSLSLAREKSRDARRVADVMQMKSALEMYFRDEGKYPDTIIPGESLVGILSSTTYMVKIPNNIYPRTDGNCADSNYVYQKLSDTSYELGFCLGRQSTSITAGNNLVTPQGVKSGELILYKNNLMARWNFEEGSGTSTADSSGNNNTGTWYGSTANHYTTGKVGQYAATFSTGNSDYVNIPDTALLNPGTGDFTVSLWVNKAGATGTYSGILTKDYNTGYGIFDVTNLGAGGIGLYIQSGSNRNEISISSLYNQWVFLSWTANNNTNITRSYINGVFQNQQNYIIGNLTNSYPLNIGRYSPQASGYFTGKLDDLRIYNRVLTDAEVLNLYNQTK